MENSLNQLKFIEAEEFGKKSLEISNNFEEKDSELVEYSIHLMSRTMLGFFSF